MDGESLATEFVICPESATKTITCGAPNEVIDVYSAKIIRLQNSYHCANPDILPNIQSGAAIICEKELSFER